MAGQLRIALSVTCDGSVLGGVDSSERSSMRFAYSPELRAFPGHQDLGCNQECFSPALADMSAAALQQDSFRDACFIYLLARLLKFST